jgi:putative oxygen-independent coproporphyrinogen III oxidase
VRQLGLYIHFPYCESLCPYCDFNSHIPSLNQSFLELQAAYIQEIDYFLSKIDKTQFCLSSIFFGGGTPSLMPPELVNAIIQYAKLHFITSDDVEITLESNPSSTESGKLQQFKQAGINRISLGIQALNDKDLQWLGRKHTAIEAKKAIAIAINNFTNVSFDLIYGRKDQTPQFWQQELQEAIDFGTPHLSLYNLTIEKGTPFYTLMRKQQLQIPSENTICDIYDITQQIMQSEGFERYEVSNYSKNMTYCKHNMLYWQVQDYIGIGAGAHGRITYSNGERMQTITHHNPQKWQHSITKYGNALQKEQPITLHEQIKETLLMGLRISHGINITDIERRFYINLNNMAPMAIEHLVNKGLIVANNTTIAPTAGGLNFVNSITKLLLHEIDSNNNS